MTVYEALSFAVAFITLMLLLNSQNNTKKKPLINFGRFSGYFYNILN